MRTIWKAAIPLVLGAGLMLGSLTTAAAPADAFTDIRDHWAKATLTRAYDDGILKGTSATTMSPDASITKAQAVTLLCRILQVSGQGSTAGLQIPVDAWYAQDAAHGAYLGFLDGSDAGTLDLPITRGEAFRLFADAFQNVRALPDKNGLAKFKDGLSLTGETAFAAANLVDSGIVVGNGGSLLADLPLTRAEFVTMLYRFADTYSPAASYSGQAGKGVVLSGAAALEGSAIVGHQASGKYTLYRRKEEIKHYRKRAQELLRKARPLMDIYREDRKQEYLSKYARYPEGEELRIVCNQMPVSTMSHALLLSVLERSSLPEAAGEEILDYWAAGREALEAQIQHGTVHIIIPHLTREQFAQSPLSLSLSDLFLEAEPVYTYEDYCRHLEETCAMAQTAGNAAAESTAAESDAAGNAAAESQVEASRTNHTTASPNSADGRLLVELNPNPAFCNISYTVAGDKYVIVSKEKSPVIHFVIHHKRMIQAFQRFIPSSTD